MMLIPRLSLFLFATFLAADPIGSGLADGTRLVYESAGASQPPWIYDSVRVVQRAEFDRCVMVTRREQTPREHCARGDTLFVRQASGAYVVRRPLGPRMEMDVPTASGDVLYYTTGDADVREVAGVSVSFLPTTIVTRTSEGVATRRLREQYATSLLTALWGVFEQPDSTGGWTPSREFQLVEIAREGRD